MSSVLQGPFAPSWEGWEPSSLNYDNFQSLLEKVVQQIDSIGLDNALLQSMSNHGSEGIPLDGECYPTLAGGFNVSSLQLSFEIYLSVDIKDIHLGTDGDIFKRRANQVYRTLTSGHTDSIIPEIVGDQTQIFDISGSTPDDTSARMREMSLVELPRITPKLCPGCDLQSVQVPVACATSFFRAIAAHSFALKDFQAERTSTMKDRILRFSRNLLKVTAPTRISGNKSDIDTWRPVIKLYMDAGVLAMKPRESILSGARVNNALHLTALQNDFDKKRLRRSFKRAESHGLLDELFKISTECLQLQGTFDFERQEIIRALEMFDEKTFMKIQSPFTRFLGLDEVSSNPEHFLDSINTVFSSEVALVIPQVDDYICIICTDLAFKPIRLGCGHHFCIRCMIRLQKQKHKECPVCRQHTVLAADSYSINYELLRFLETFFPSEAKRKQHENEKAVAEERFRF